MPAYTTAEEVLAYEPDGVFLSNSLVIGRCRWRRERGAKTRGKLPIFGFVLVTRSWDCHGAKTFKLKFGHEARDHPVSTNQPGKLRSQARITVSA